MEQEELDYIKLLKIIESCKTKDHCIVTSRVIDNYKKMYSSEDAWLVLAYTMIEKLRNIDPIKIRNNKITGDDLNVLFS